MSRNLTREEQRVFAKSLRASVHIVSDWQPIETAPAGAWIKTRSDTGHEGVHIKDAEPGWWEDETGDWSVEASHNNGHGITEWTYLPADYVISDYEGTLRDGEPKATPPQQA